MAPRKDVMPSVSTFADHEVITPPNVLRKAIASALDGNDDPVGRAEAALAQLSSEFAGWMHAECERLEAARQDVSRLGFTEKTHDELFRAAHDIKGEAATFGYPAVGAVAEKSLPAHRTHAGDDAHSAHSRRPARRRRPRYRPRAHQRRHLRRRR